jgi:hypothetical protein
VSGAKHRSPRPTSRIARFERSGPDAVQLRNSAVERRGENHRGSSPAVVRFAQPTGTSAIPNTLAILRFGNTKRSRTLDAEFFVEDVEYFVVGCGVDVVEGFDVVGGAGAEILQDGFEAGDNPGPVIVIGGYRRQG